MNKTIHRLISKITIVCMYFVLLGVLLYAPRIIDFFTPDQKQITVYTFMDVLSDELVRDFETRTGIKVYVKYFDNDGELLAKFEIDRGYGYDVVIPSEHIIELMRNEGVLHPIDRKKITRFKYIDSRLLNHFFDPENRYSIPFCWGTYGIGFNKKTHANTVGLDSIFNGASRVSMNEDIREITFAAALYLFGTTQGLSGEQLAQIEQLLRKQKTFVEAYGESEVVGLMLSDIVPLAFTMSSRMKKIIEEDERHGFVIPSEGGLLTIMSCVIPNASKNAQYAHQFIDYLLSKEVGVATFNIHGYNPSNTRAYEDIDLRFVTDVAFFPDDKTFKRLHLFHNEIDMKKLERLWMAVRSA